MLNEWCGYKLNLINVINMNIEINIETLLFGIDIYTDHTQSLNVFHSRPLRKKVSVAFVYLLLSCHYFCHILLG
jgi:hypothetical protein